MTLHPRSLPGTPRPQPFEIPGLAYYSALVATPAAPPAAPVSPPAQSTAAAVLDVMYGYYSPQD